MKTVFCNVSQIDKDDEAKKNENVTISVSPLTNIGSLGRPPTSSISVRAPMFAPPSSSLNADKREIETHHECSVANNLPSNLVCKSKHLE